MHVEINLARRAMIAISVALLTTASIRAGEKPAIHRPVLPEPELSLRAADLGIQLLPFPQRTATGARLVARGPSPRQLKAKIIANINAADTTNADQIWVGGSLGLNLTGAGLTVGIWDGGAIRSTHQELTGRVSIIDAVGIIDHATHVAGTIGATGVNPAARGMASGVLLRSRDFNNDISEMATDAPLINLSNHSYSFIRGWTNRIDWGIGPVDSWFADRSVDSVEDSEFGKYEDVSKDLDQVLADNPYMLSVWSAANDRGEPYTNAHGTDEYMTYLSADPGGVGWTEPGFYLVPNAGATSAPPADGNAGTGYDCLPNDQVAKNSLVVGAVFDVTNDPYALGDVVLASFSSTGPPDDGRVKPDVVGNGIGLTSSTASSDSSYASFSGTSMSSPNVCGTAALLVQYYQNLAGSIPASATSKGLVIHTAFDAGNFGPDYSFGWGLVDAAAAARFLTDALNPTPNVHHLIESTYGGAAQDYSFVASGGGSLKATLVWTDPPPAAVPGFDLDDSTPVLVNDLDLAVIGPPASTTYRPWTLDPANPSALAVRTARNAVDNVEQVWIEAPAVGTYIVRVSHTGAAPTQAYSLLVSVDRGCATCPGDIDGNSAADGRDVQLFTTCQLGGGTAGQRACADMNGDGWVDSVDVDPFVQRLVNNPGACP